jgi:hypothetical protein
MGPAATATEEQSFHHDICQPVVHQKPEQRQQFTLCCMHHAATAAARHACSAFVAAVAEQGPYTSISPLLCTLHSAIAPKSMRTQTYSRHILHTSIGRRGAQLPLF